MFKHFNPKMKYFIIAVACWLTLPLVAQSPFKPQLAVPVYFNNTTKHTTKADRTPASTFLSGIALLFLDTVNTADELFVTGGSDLVVWHESVGRSTKATFIIPDSQFVGRLELMYFDSKCHADIWWQDRNSAEESYASGELMANEKGEYALHLTADAIVAQQIGNIFHPLNTQLMQLHSRNQRRVAMKSWFNRDSTNIIVGADSQFDTDYDLLWLDQSLRQRLQSVASNAFSKLFLFSNQNQETKDSVVSATKQIHHRAVRKGNGVRGTLTINFKPDNSARYVFLKPFQRYRILIEYDFVYSKHRPSELTIRKFGLRNANNGDFVEMDIYDFVNNGLPVMYVDLIRGVVTAADAWDITNVIHAIEDVVAASRLPLE